MATKIKALQAATAVSVANRSQGHLGNTSTSPLLLKVL